VPSEILARQHFTTLKEMLIDFDLNIEILTGRDKGSQRSLILSKLQLGKIDILIGTHALFQPDVIYNDLRLSVIDEQHRFGVRQRMELSEKGGAVDVLVMSATPIPRSLSLAQYGDMDLSIIDEKPIGRKPIKTVLVSNSRLNEIVERLKKAIEDDKQIYWVCPLVSESEVLDLTSAEDRFLFLRKFFNDNLVGIIHGQLKSSEKDETMKNFVSGKIKILVATTVIEVGVDVPNASIMVIEHAERFGLAQLHQLRGRVGRGSVESSCLLLFDGSTSGTAINRLSILRETEDGFIIAENDLKLRGGGDLIGLEQSGLPKFRIADMVAHAKLMSIAHQDARILLNQDPNLSGVRGKAAQNLLYLMERENSIRLITIG
jgi:ATP-dependent DNA helicase RecG